MVSMKGASLVALRHAFWNSTEKRLRAGWRLLLQLCLFAICLIAMALLSHSTRNPSVVLACAALYTALGLAQAWVLARFVDRRPLVAFGFHFSRAWWLNLAFGLLLGAALMSGIFACEYAAGWIDFSVPDITTSGLRPLPALALSLPVYLSVSFNEEFAFRAYQLRNLAEGLHGRRLNPRQAITAAWLISSLAFSLGHITNDNSTLLSTLNLVLGGLLLSLPLLLSGELAICLGLHLSWNLFQGTVYGFPVSGSVPTRNVLVIAQHGPAIWTGGAFGPEGGLLGTAWTLAGCLLVVLWLRRRGHVDWFASLACYEPFNHKLPAVRIH
jgi:uncharacterized protein